jgi:agmatinase
MRLPWVNSAEELRDIRPDAAIIGAPVDMGVVHRPGARFGPRAIRQADYYASDYRLLYHMGLEIYPMKVLTVVDYGDANCPPSDLAKAHEAIRAKVTEALEAGAIPMVLGGTTRSLCRSARRWATSTGTGRWGWSTSTPTPTPRTPPTVAS